MKNFWQPEANVIFSKMIQQKFRQEEETIAEDIKEESGCLQQQNLSAEASGLISAALTEPQIIESCSSHTEQTSPEQMVSEAPGTIVASVGELQAIGTCSARTEQAEPRSQDELVSEAPVEIATSLDELQRIESCSSSTKKAKARSHEESSDDEQEIVQPKSKVFRLKILTQP